MQWWCMPNKIKHSKNFKDLTGTIFGYWKVLYLDNPKSKATYWICKCKCGTVRSVNSSNLISGKSTSCGCYNKIQNSKDKKIHGMSDTRFYKIWIGMKKRCLNPKSRIFSYYGGRGIKVCDKWIKSFNIFMEDMYNSYLKHVERYGEKETSLERKNVNGNYCKSNCKWATLSEQMKNRRNYFYLKLDS